MSWQHPDEQPRGRSTLWLHPNIPLRFVFDEPEHSRAGLLWIERLAPANSTRRHPAHPEELDVATLDPIGVERDAERFALRSAERDAERDIQRDAERDAEQDAEQDAERAERDAEQDAEQAQR